MWQHVRGTGQLLNNQTPKERIVKALRNQNLKVAIKMLNKDPDLAKIKNLYGEEVLFNFVIIEWRPVNKIKSIILLATLLELKADINAVFNKMIPLTRSILNNDLILFNYLLENNANPLFEYIGLLDNKTTPIQFSLNYPVIYLCKLLEKINILDIKYLFDAIINHNRSLPMHIKCMLDKIDKNHINENEFNFKINLLMAVILFQQEHRMEILNFLLEYGVDPNKKMLTGKSTCETLQSLLIQDEDYLEEYNLLCNFEKLSD